MKNRTLIASFSLAALSLFAVGAQAQHAQHHPSEQNPGPGMMGGGMMGQGMMGQAMMAHHQEMQKLMGQLRQSMAAMESEKDPAALQKLMTEHHALLEKMHSQMAQQGKVMSDFMKNCPMMGANQKSTSK